MAGEQIERGPARTHTQGRHRRARPADRGDPAGEPARRGPRAGAQRGDRPAGARRRGGRARRHRRRGNERDGARRARAAAPHDPQPDRQCPPPRRRRGARGDGRAGERAMRGRGARPRPGHSGRRAGARSSSRSIGSPARPRPAGAAGSASRWCARSPAITAATCTAARPRAAAAFSPSHCRRSNRLAHDPEKKPAPHGLQEGRG